MTLAPFPRTPNRLIESLGAVCSENLFAEKWLVAPNLRLGHEWLERVSFEGEPVLNARATTLFHLAQRLSAPKLSKPKKNLLTQLSNIVLVDRVWTSISSSNEPYLAALHPSWSLFQTVASALAAFRMAGVSSRALSPSRFELPKKGEEIRKILSAYETELEKSGRADRAEVFRIATEELRANPSLLEEGTLILVPEDLEPLEMEKRFLEAIPGSKKIVLPVDPVWERKTGDLPIDFFCAIGEVNEAREVVRRILSSGARLDQVEILHTDRETYVPLLFEISETFSEDSHRQLPVTFEEGVPVSFTRPGRAFSVWLRWISEGHPQGRLVEMLREGLLRLAGDNALQGFAETLQGVRIGFGIERYTPKIDKALAALRRKTEGPSLEGEDEDSGGEMEREGLFGARINKLAALQKALPALLELSKPPDEKESPISALTRAEVFVKTFAAASGERDQYAAKALADKIRELRQGLPKDAAPLNVDVWDWLTDLPHSVRILGSRPSPGRLHVAPLALGGHSGRTHTFILGLDDGRFPGANLQDPILLDSERKSISGALPTAADRFERKIEDYWRLLGRLRGEATLSYSSREIVEDREVFPSPLLVETHRRYTGNREEDMNGFVATLPPPISFTPSNLEDGLNDREFFLSQLTDSQSPKDAQALVRGDYPHLCSGREAQERRDSEELSAYDGILSTAILSSARNPISPLSENGAVLSPTALEEMGRCPLAYYFKKILGLSPPDDLGRDPSVWLNPLEAGSLLHEVFKQLVERLIERGDPVSFARHEAELLEILDYQIARYRELEPPPDQAALIRQSEEFRLAARLFLKEEETHTEDRQPYRVEMGFGMSQEGSDSSEPVRIYLSESESLRLRGRIDRIDREGDGAFVLWDYKSGGAKRYRDRAPFNQGRIVQPYLYWAAAEKLLQAEFGAGAKVRSFGYFFPTEKGMTDRIVYEADQLEAGGEIVRHLCELMDRGVFLPTDNVKDCDYCDFRLICGDVEKTTDNSNNKLANETNLELEPFRRLRAKDAE